MKWCKEKREGGEGLMCGAAKWSKRESRLSWDSGRKGEEQRAGFTVDNRAQPKGDAKRSC